MQEPKSRCPGSMLLQLAMAAPLQAPPRHATNRPTARSPRLARKGPRWHPPLPRAWPCGSPICVRRRRPTTTLPSLLRRRWRAPFSGASPACIWLLPPPRPQLHPPGVSPASPLLWHCMFLHPRLPVLSSPGHRRHVSCSDEQDTGAQGRPLPCHGWHCVVPA